MKYMTFNSSCSYAGVANLLEEQKVDVEDWELAKLGEIPYLFSFDEGQEAFLAGPELQTKKWFNYCLHPLGFELEETAVERADVPDYLRRRGCRCMLGLTAGGRKHAYVFAEHRDGAFHFINNKHRESDEPERVTLSREELLAALEERVMVASLVPCPRSGDREEKLADMRLSLRTLEQYRVYVDDYASRSVPVQTLRGDMDRVFRALLLGVPDMMKIAGERELQEQLAALLGQFMAAVRRDGEVRVFDFVAQADFHSALDAYSEVIRRRMGELVL